MAKQIVLEEYDAGTRSSTWFMPLLALVFFLSGITGLIYQVLWLRKLALVFGVTVYAASTVLASFMAGLALGSLLAGRLVDRARNPLLWYGVAEVLVGLSALATPAALDWVERLYVSLYPAMQDGLWQLTLARFLLSSAVLIVPTTLMGATLPIVVKSSLFRAAGLGERVSFLYATNTAGAIFGALLAGFYLIGGLGILKSFQLAAALNTLVGVVAVAASLGLKPVKEDPAELPDYREPAAYQADTPVPERAGRLVLIVFMISGFVSLALEVIWFRMLVLFSEATTYAFTIMLATVLSGIAVGSYVATPLMRRRLNWLMVLAVLEMGIGITSVFSLRALAKTADVMAWAEPLLSSVVADKVTPMLVTSFMAMFPATLLMGIAFPIGARIWAAGQDASKHAGKRVGLFYSLNVFGAILGPVAAGFLLLPRLGSKASLIVVAAISLALGLLLLTTLARSRRLLAVSTGAVGTLLFLGAALSAQNPFTAVLSYRYPGEQLLWYNEGEQTTASVHQAGETRVLYLDGLRQMDGAHLSFHLKLAHLPMQLHPDPREVLVIGLGGGVTAGELSKYPGVGIDVIELSKSVIYANDWFRDVNSDAVRQPNVHMRIDDGRNYLLLTDKRYDIITSDLIRPYHAGAGNLYSEEFFRLAHRALKEDGLILQFIPQGNETQYKLIVRTFLSVFPHTTLWEKGRLMIGAKQPLELDPADFERKLQDASSREILKTLGISDFQSLLSRYKAGPEELKQFVGPGPVLTDDRPLAEYFLSLPRQPKRIDLSGLEGDVTRHIKRRRQGDVSR